jgi:Tfp pilus assembly protein FimV
MSAFAFFPTDRSTAASGDRSPRRHALLAILLVSLSVCAMVEASAAQPTESLTEQGRAALRHLLSPQPGAASAPATSTATTSPPASEGGAMNRTRILVRPGESLDRVIGRTMRDSPFRIEVLRSAFVRLNREAVPRGTPHPVSAGATLVVPTMTDILGMVDPQRQPGSAQAQAPALAQTPVRAAQPTETDRRSWVRYP